MYELTGSALETPFGSSFNCLTILDRDWDVNPLRAPAQRTHEADVDPKAPMPAQLDEEHSKDIKRGCCRNAEHNLQTLRNGSMTT